MRNSTPDNSTGRPTTKVCCTGCGNDVHPKGDVCPERGKNCLDVEGVIILLECARSGSLTALVSRSERYRVNF